MVLIEGTLFVTHVLMIFPGFRIIIIIACGSERPLKTRNSRQLSNLAESLPSS